MRAAFLVFLVACVGEDGSTPGETSGGGAWPGEQAPLPQLFTLTVTDPVQPGETIGFLVQNAAPNADIKLIRSNGGIGAGSCPPVLGGQCLDIKAGTSGYIVQVNMHTDATGRAVFQAPLPAGLPVGSNLTFQAVDPVRDVGSNPAVRVVQSPCTDDALEPDDGFATANPVGSGSSTSAWSCPADSDWFSIAATTGQVLDISASFDPLVADVDLRLFSPAGVLVETANFQFTSPEVISYSAPGPGPYLLEVYSESSATDAGGGYSLGVVVSTPATCAADAFEPNDVGATQARALSDGTHLGLTTCTTGDYDWYYVDLASGQSLNADVLFDVGEGDLDAWLLPSTYANDTSLFDQHFLARGVTGGSDEHLVWTAGVTGRYYLVVKMYQDAGGALQGNDYDLSVSRN